MLLKSKMFPMQRRCPGIICQIKLTGQFNRLWRSQNRRQTRFKSIVRWGKQLKTIARCRKDKKITRWGKQFNPFLSFLQCWPHCYQNPAFSKRFVGAGHSEEGGGQGGEGTLPSARRARTFRGGLGVFHLRNCWKFGCSNTYTCSVALCNNHRTL